MTRWFLGAALALTVAGAANAAPVSFTVVAPDTYQSFVGNWPGAAPLCAEIDSQARWDKVMHPAPVMGGSKPFSPDAAFWASHMLLMIARVIPAQGSVAPFASPAVNSRGSAVTVSYHFTRPRPASSTIKDYLALAVPRSAPTSVAFTENGRTVCAVRPASGLWVSPASVGR